MTNSKSGKNKKIFRDNTGLGKQWFAIVTDNCQTEDGGDQSVSHETCDSDFLFENLV